MSTEPLALLDRALEQTGAIIARVRPDQASAPTPCTEWTVRQLVNHVVHDVQGFTLQAQGGRFASSDADIIGDDWVTAYDRAAQGLRAAWREPGALERTVKMPFGELPASWQVGQHYTDLAVHAWDVARATGHSPELDAAIVDAALDWGQQSLKPEFRGQAFGPEVKVPSNAPTYDRLVAFFGRDPAWSSPT
jgi:uncharacterized protein (TIGR03086 family)